MKLSESLDGSEPAREQSPFGLAAVWRTRFAGYLPGLLVSGLATLAAAHISSRYNAPLTLIALLVGLSLNFLSSDARLARGLAFPSRTLLRLSIVLLGVRVTTSQFTELGPSAFITVTGIAFLALMAGALAGRWLRFGAAFGTLAGGAVAICGASAALAFFGVLGERRISQAQLALVLVGISTMSSLAMVAYPILAHALQLGDTAAGFLLGAAIHDVAQALGAGYTYSSEAGDVAAIVKMSRVALLAPALLVVGICFAHDNVRKGVRPGIPWFVIGFFLVAAFNAAGFISAQAGAVSQDIASALLAWAVAATGIRSPMHCLLQGGFRPLWVIIIPTLLALALASAAALLLF